MPNDRADSNAYNLFPEGDLEKWGENLPALVEINVPDKGLIYREGDRCTKVFCIIKGVVKLSVMTEQGNELTTALLRRGEIFGSLPARVLTRNKGNSTSGGRSKSLSDQPRRI